MKNIIITWVSSWLWYSLSKLFLNKWFNVIWLSRTKSDLDLNHFKVDFTNEISIKNCSEKIIFEYDWKIDCIINCAAIWYIEDLNDVDFEKTREVFSVNLWGQNYFLSQLSDLIKKSWTDIVFIWATIWYKANGFMPIYSMSKWGLRWMIENWRAFLSKTKNRVIWIHPGWLDTQSNIWPEWRETLISEITWKPVWSLISTDEISKLVYTFINLPKNIEISEVIINRK